MVFKRRLTDRGVIQSGRERGRRLCGMPERTQSKTGSPYGWLVSVPGWAIAKPRIFKVILETVGKGGKQTVHG